MKAHYVEIGRILSKALGQPARSDNGLDGIFDILSRIAQPAHLIELISSISGDPDAITSCAARSFRHPLGFDKIMLVGQVPLFTLRVHVWRPSNTLRVDHIHNHRFDFVTTVIRGGYDMELFQLDESGVPMIEHEERTSGVGEWKLHPIGEARLKLLTTHRIRPHSAYDLRSHAFHRVIVDPNRLCMTLFLQSTPTATTTRVFAKSGELAPATNSRHTLTPKLYRDELETLLDDLACRPER
jgi:predicted metal-dependent enzyme (double-stranded beta helix superfamily)